MPRPLSHNGLIFLKLQASAPREAYSGLLYVAADKGYKRGWVAQKFRTIFGKWPKPLTPVEPAEPSHDLREWLGLERRRFRARMKRQESKASKAAPVLIAHSEFMASDDWEVPL
jgi:hypothetical protein